MKNAFITGVATGTSYVVPLLLQSGTVEIINDTNYLLSVTFHTGSSVIVPGMAYLYPCPENGGTVTLATGTLATYANEGQGPGNSLVVNQYLPGEINSSSYPLFIGRSIAISNNPFVRIVSGGPVALSAGLTLTAPPLFGDNDLWCSGFDVSFDQEGTAHSVNVTLSGVATQGNPWVPVTLNYVYRTQVTGGVFDRVRFPNNLKNVDQNTSIVLTIPATAGGTAQITANLYCMSM